MDGQCGVLGDQTGWIMLTKSKQRGVSLIELMVGIIIVSLLFALAATNYSGWIQNQQIRTAAESILNGIQVTRSEAVKNNAQVRFVLCGLPASSWEVLAASAPAAAPAASLACGAGSNAAAGEIRVQERSGQEGSRLAQVFATSQLVPIPVPPILLTPDGSTTITFNSFGRVVANADGSASIQRIEVATPAGDRPLGITVGAAGNTRMCDPSPLLAATDPRHC